MKKKLLCIVLIMTVVMVISARGDAATFLPPKGKTLLLIGQDIDAIEEYTREVGSVPAGVMLYTSIQDLEGLDDRADRGGGVQHGRYFVERYLYSALQIGLYMVGALDGVVSGKYDQNIDQLAEWIRATHRPVYLRIGYEYDLPDNRYDPKQYKEAFSKIVDRFRELNVDNVAYVWHSYAGYVEGDRMRWYPGDEYVDWFGLSFFDAYNMGNFHAIANQSKRHGKPLMIAESTPRFLDLKKGRQVWRNWYKRMFTFAREADVRVISYINCNWDELPMFAADGWGDARIQQNKDLLVLWHAKTGMDEFLLPSLVLYNHLGFR